jgi:radical SAM superfamily enzyme YgiQ (UPF0313 family)
MEILRFSEGAALKNINVTNNKNEHVSLEKILLINFPFWSPLIPAQGIANLKSFLQQYGYSVRTVDAASEKMFMEHYDDYFEALKGIVPPDHRGNFNNIGHEVLRHHMMAHTNYDDETRYRELVKILVYNTYYSHADEDQVSRLNEIIADLFADLEHYMLDLLSGVKPDVLGLTAHSGNLAMAKFALELTRNRYPHIKTVMGGSIFFNHLSEGTPDLEAFLERTESYLDKIIMGKGEVLFLKYLRGELPESQRVYTSWSQEKEEPGLYTIDIPDLTDFDLQKYFYLAATSSYSCPFECSFCNSLNYFGKYRERDPKQTVKEMKRLQERHGHKLFFMTDSLLNTTITGLSKELIANDLTAYMDAYFRVDKPSADIENTLLWRNGGFYRARIGTESGSQHVLDLMGKHITPEMIKSTICALAQAGIKTTTYWVIGHPGETEEDFQKTLDLIEELKNEIWQAECNPFTYHFTGQMDEEQWADKRMLLYPEDARDMLIIQTWVLDCYPPRQEIYRRVYRFEEHCKKLGIPNPYSADELFKADERWKKLHRNAVPSLMDLANNNFDIDERKKVKQMIAVKSHYQEEGDFDF